MKASIPLSQLKEFKDATVKYVEQKLCEHFPTNLEPSKKIGFFQKSFLKGIKILKGSNPSFEEKRLDFSLRERIFSMGIVPGVSIQRMGDCPLGDPVIINVNGHLISLRKGEADLITVETSL